MKIEPKNNYKLIDIIKFIINSDQEYIMDNYDLYVKVGDDNVSNHLICYVSEEPIEIDDKDNEIYPKFVVNNELEYFCSGQLLEDVVYNVQHQLKNKNKVQDIEQFVVSLDFYLENDNFLDII